MGCDIHCFQEVKINGKWHCANQPRIDRNYELFEYMAGVRGDENNAAFPVRGLPDDLSEYVSIEADIWGDDAHAHSWITGDEVEQTHKWIRAQGWRNYWYSPFGYLFGNGWADGDAPRPVGYEEARLVFWFDN